jgi:hypothetical protein
VRSNPSLFDPSLARTKIGRPDDQGFVAGNYSGMRHSPMALIMLDGKVLILRGSTSDPRYSAGLDRDAVLVAEEFDPVPSEWKSLPTSPIVHRVCDSVALLQGLDRLASRSG